MRESFVWIGNPYQSFAGNHNCPLKEDIARFGYSRRWLDSMPDCACFTEHAVKGEVQAKPVLVLDYAEFKRYLEAYYGREFAQEGVELLQSQEAKRMTGFYKHSPTLGLVFLQEWSALWVMPLTHEIHRTSTYTMPVDGSWHYGTRLFIGDSEHTYKNCVFVNCTITVPMKDVTFENCVFLSCSVRNMEHVTFDGGILSVNVYDSTLTNVRAVVHGAALYMTRCELNRFKLQAVSYGSLSLEDSYYWRCVLPTETLLCRCISGKQAKHVCTVCKEVRNDVSKVSSRFWLCSLCKSNKQSYSAANDEYKGKPDSLPCFSFELETAGESGDASYAMLAYGFIATDDGSVDTEYKSPRYLSLAAALPALKRIDTFADDAIDSRCGTHIHVDCRVKRHVSPDVFYPLIRYMQAHQQETTRFWGRYFRGYAAAQSGIGHTDAFSLSSRYDTLEYRLPLFVNVKQYLEVIRFVRACTRTITDYYTYVPADVRSTDELAQKVLSLYQKAVRG